MLCVYVICVLAALLSLVWAPIAILIGSPRARRILISYDRVANATFGGSDRETISSRAYRGTQEGVRGWCVLCKLLNLVQQDHCEKSEGY